MATVVALLAKQRGGPKIDFQVLFSPTTDANFDTPSYKQFAEGYFLTREAMKWFWNHYAPDVSVRELPTAAPLRASMEQLRGLPPALIISQNGDWNSAEPRSSELMPRYGLRETMFCTPRQGFCQGSVPFFNCSMKRSVIV
jgi:hypothetical protein